MRLKLLLSTLLVAMFGAASAQQYSQDYIIKDNTQRHREVEMIYGVIAGVVMPKLSERSDKIGVENKAGYGFGMMWGVDLGLVEVVPEFWYTHTQAELTVKSTSENYDMVSHTIEVPIMVSIPVAGSGVRFNVAPTFALMNNSKIKIDGEEDIEMGRTKAAAGYLIGASMMLGEHLLLDVRYSGHYDSKKVAWHEGSDSYDYRQYNFGVNLGYRF